MPPSRLELVAEVLIKRLGLLVETQYRFHPTRRWRADFKVWKGETSCLIEIEGLARFNSQWHHQSAKGYENDCRKYLAATLLGWTVLRFTENMIADGTMENALKEWFGG